jgi:hypothetical protein
MEYVPRRARTASASAWVASPHAGADHAQEHLVGPRDRRLRHVDQRERPVVVLERGRPHAAERL